jgi:[acyl-carrier-protein] S-malonyltransferase
MMPKLVFMFPGQASQYPGMGRELAEHFDEARAVFDEADIILDFSLSELCFNGSEEALRRTENTQPAILACSVAAFRVLAAKGVQPEFVAGHSLGEYSALVAAGALSFKEAVVTVRKRGQYMQEAVAEGVGAMAAVTRMPLAELEQVCRDAAQGEVVAPANINSPDQIVISGHDGAVRRAVALAKERGARRALLLQVSAPFHCELMRPAQERLSFDLEKLHFHNLRFPLVNNVGADIVKKAADARAGLIAQVSSPVLWEKSIRKLIAQGARHFVEVGPGKVLCGLLRQIDPSVTALNVQDLGSLAATLQALDVPNDDEDLQGGEEGREGETA